MQRGPQEEYKHSYTVLQSLRAKLCTKGSSASIIENYCLIYLTLNELAYTSSHLNPRIHQVTNNQLERMEAYIAFRADLVYRKASFIYFIQINILSIPLVFSCSLRPISLKPVDWNWYSLHVVPINLEEFCYYMMTILVQT